MYWSMVDGGVSSDFISLLSKEKDVGMQALWDT